MKGSLTIVGLGPGAPELITPAVTDALKDSTDIVGYSKYIERVKDSSGKSFHPSDNREKLIELNILLILLCKEKRWLLFLLEILEFLQWPQQYLKL